MKFVNAVAICLICLKSASGESILSGQSGSASNPDPIDIAKIQISPYNWSYLQGRQYRVAFNENYDREGRGGERQVIKRETTYAYQITSCSHENGYWDLSVKSTITISGSLVQQNVEQAFPDVEYNEIFNVSVSDRGVIQDIGREPKLDNEENTDATQIANSAVEIFIDFLIIPHPPQGTGGYYWVNADDISVRKSVGRSRNDAKTLWSVIQENSDIVNFMGNERTIIPESSGTEGRNIVGLTTMRATCVLDKKLNVFVSGEFELVHYGLKSKAFTHGKYILVEDSQDDGVEQ